jgi:peptide/nickel transport system permease protein
VLTFLLRRILQLIIVLVAVLSVLFFLLRLSGDPVVMMAGETASPETIAQIRQSMGLDDALPVQYGRFLVRAATLDFGDSITARQDALALVVERLPFTIGLTFASMGLAIGVGLPLGILAGARRDAPESHLVQVCAFIAQSMPSYWLGILLILVFSVQLGWLPSFGTGGLRYFILPSVTLAALPAAKIALLIRSGLLQILGDDYIRTARAKGLSSGTLLWRHALPNVLIPVVTVVGMDLGQLFGGAVITETIFAWPGVGRQLIQAVGFRDYPIVQASVFVTVILVVAINALADMTYRLIDPRIAVA